VSGNALAGLVTRGGIGVLLVLLVVSGGNAYSASSSVPTTALGHHQELTIPRDFAPAECLANIPNAALNSLVLRIHPDAYTVDNELILGTAGDDTIDASGGRDCIVGGDGADAINGQGGADVILGGAGADDLRGGGGNDFIFGNDGDDTLRGNNGTDVCDGGPGTDSAPGGTCETEISIP
jgi:hypothetical protein